MVYHSIDAAGDGLYVHTHFQIMISSDERCFGRKQKKKKKSDTTDNPVMMLGMYISDNSWLYLGWRNGHFTRYHFIVQELSKQIIFTNDYTSTKVVGVD